MKKKFPKTKQLLLELSEELDAFLEGHTRPGYTYGFATVKHIKEKKVRKEYYEQLRGVERSRYVKLQKQGDKIIAVFTERGAYEALKLRILTSSASMMSGEVCLVVFDVPERIARVRNAFRRLLKAAGFYQIQRSVWEGERDVVDELRELVKIAGASDYIRIYRSLQIR